MTKKTIELIIKIAGLVLEVLIFLKDKINGRKENGDKRIAKKK